MNSNPLAAWANYLPAMLRSIPASAWRSGVLEHEASVLLARDDQVRATIRVDSAAISLWGLTDEYDPFSDEPEELPRKRVQYFEVSGDFTDIFEEVHALCARARLEKERQQLTARLAEIEEELRGS